MRVISTDGVGLAVYEHGGGAERPTVVAVHGYPDNHSIWDGVVAILSQRYHVVTYDVRGSGQSDKPSQRAAYRIPQLVDDLDAVLSAVSPGRPVHLLAHDWGSIQSWPAVCQARFASRVASFTSISGPSLDHAGAWLRAARSHPRAVARQLMDSYYIAAFQIPGLAELMWRSGVSDRVLARAGRIAHSAQAAEHVPQRSTADKINGLHLYRANMLHRVGRARPGYTDIPVQVLAPESDAFVTTELQTQAPKPYAADLRSRVIPGGHWVISERPDLIARLTAEFIEFVDGGTEPTPR